MVGKAKKITYADKIIVVEYCISFWVTDKLGLKNELSKGNELKRENPFSYWNS